MVFLAIFIDLIAVGALKVIVRRPRPFYNNMDMKLAAPGDAYSFPSGHTSRAAMLAVIFAYLSSDILYYIGFYLAAMTIGISRLMLGRHYCSDVVGGLLLGVIEGMTIINCWLSPETTASLIAALQLYFSSQ